MKMKKIVVLVLLVGLIVFSGCSSANKPEPKNSAAEEAAIICARNWLELVDNGQYPESWDQAAKIFKNAVTESQWDEAMRSMRAPLGKCLSREVKSKDYRTTLPGAPEGQYVVIQFSSAFENKKPAIETVTPMLDADSKWHVSGYYMK